MNQVPHTIIHTDFDAFYETFQQISAEGNLDNSLNAIKQMEDSMFIQLNPDDDFIFLNYSLVSSLQSFELEIPSCITTIENGFCQQVDNLVSLKIPTNVSSIGDYAFIDCKNLKCIEFNEGLVHIGRNAFSHCKSLTDVAFPNSLQQIDDLAFSDCNNLSNIELNSDLKVALSAFEYTRIKNHQSFKVKASA